MGANACRPVQDRFFQSLAGARVDVLLGEAALGGRNGRDGLLERAVGAIAPPAQAGLVEVDVGFDEARGDEAAVELLFGSRVGQAGFDRDEAPSAHADVDRITLPACDAGIPEDQIKVHDRSESAVRIEMGIGEAAIHVPNRCAIVGRCSGGSHFGVERDSKLQRGA